MKNPEHPRPPTEAEIEKWEKESRSSMRILIIAATITAAIYYLLYDHFKAEQRIVDCIYTVDTALSGSGLEPLTASERITVHDKIMRNCEKDPDKALTELGNYLTELERKRNSAFPFSDSSQK